jgi:Protein of unknown function (DUF1592)/Protein of unknown function (DUF1588)/Protein of unknown function (DUF1587)/Protein of unknown function (DUF1595)/Protein of unknown function (DUF1585)
MKTSNFAKALVVITVTVGGCVGTINGPKSGPGSSGAGTGSPVSGGAPASGNGGTPSQPAAGAGSVGPGGTAQGGGGSAAGPTGSPTTTAAATDPGRVTLHRLNRAEYNNTVADLFGTSLRPADAFPADDPGGDFDNIADVLSLSPLHLSMYQTAAQTLLDEALSNPAERARLVTCDLTAPGTACARSILGAFMPRAWRRPVDGSDVDTHMAVVTTGIAQGLTTEAALELALTAVLMSPHFVFRVELDPDPLSLAPHPLGGYELASRLSYFLWSTMPDDGLMKAAGDGSLLDAGTLASQVDRMLASPKAESLVSNFAGQWLYIRQTQQLQPDPTAFPSFDQPLRDAMQSEAELLFRDVALNGAPVDTLLTATYLYANDRLASHYGLPPVGSATPVKVALGVGNHRGGILAQAGFLTATSHPVKTSPVKRGKWVLNQLLCFDVPPPPPGVQTSLDNSTVTGTLRQVLEAHRSDPNCSSCHLLMDPIGFGLENYDAVGAYRTQDSGLDIDSAGQLPSGATFSGAAQLSALVAADPSFPGCVVQKLYAYALGRLPDRTPTQMDGQTLASITASFRGNGLAFKTLVKSIVTAPTFLNRRGEPVAP